MASWYSSIYKAFLYASIICFIIGFFSTPQVTLASYIAGYSVLSLCIMMILIILFNGVLKTTTNNSTLQVLYNILMTSGPFILILGIIGFVLYLLIKYYNKISSGQISSSYNSFNNIIVLLISVQIYLIYTNIDNSNFEFSGKISKVTSSIIYLLGLLTIICSVNLYIILKYFTTDGFKTLNI